jgi:hypothetical protein
MSTQIGKQSNYRRFFIGSSMAACGAIAGFIASIVLFRIFCMGPNGEDAPPGGGIFLILAWVTLVPLGGIVGLVAAFMLGRRGVRSQLQ